MRCYVSIPGHSSLRITWRPCWLTKKVIRTSLERALVLTKEFETSAPNPYFLDTLGWVHLKLGHRDEALRFIQQAAAKAPDHPVLNYHLGIAYFKAGHTAEAKTHLQKAVASQKNFQGLDDAKSVLAQLQG